MPVLLPMNNADIRAPLISRNHTEWSFIPHNAARRRANNIVRVAPGPTGEVPVGSDPKTIFGLLFPDQIIDIVIRFTNKYALECYEAYNILHGTELVWQAIVKIELESLLGILTYAGSTRSKKQPVSKLWTSNCLFKQPFYSASMGRNRFRSTLRYLRFDDRSARHTARARGDRLPKDAPVQHMVQIFNENLRRLFKPG